MMKREEATASIKGCGARRTPWPLLAATLGAATALALADMPSSPNYELEQYAVTGGRGNTNTPPGSIDYRLEACSVGGIADNGTASASYVLYPGYLVPWLMLGGSPDILSHWLAAGRLYLTWRPVTNADGYRVDCAANLWSNFAADVSGVGSGTTWNCPMPAAAAKFYRVVATNGP